jgi:hypothetical protein
MSLEELFGRFRTDSLELNYSDSSVNAYLANENHLTNVEVSDGTSIFLVHPLHIEIQAEINKNEKDKEKFRAKCQSAPYLQYKENLFKLLNSKKREHKIILVEDPLYFEHSTKKIFEQYAFEHLIETKPGTGVPVKNNIIVPGIYAPTNYVGGMHKDACAGDFAIILKRKSNQSVLSLDPVLL